MRSEFLCPVDVTEEFTVKQDIGIDECQHGRVWRQNHRHCSRLDASSAPAGAAGFAAACIVRFPLNRGRASASGNFHHQSAGGESIDERSIGKAPHASKST